MRKLHVRLHVTKLLVIASVTCFFSLNVNAQLLKKTSLLVQELFLILNHIDR